MASIAGSDSPACPYQARKQRLSSTSVLILPGRPPQGADWAVQRQLGLSIVPSGVRVLCVQQPCFPAGQQGQIPDARLHQAGSSHRQSPRHTVLVQPSFLGSCA